MARNGSGQYNLPTGNPVVSGTTISSTVHNNTMSDVATALTNSLAKNGETTPTANLPMGGYKLTGLAAGSLAGESVRYEQVGTLALAQGALASASPTITSGPITFPDSTQMGTAASLGGFKNRIINGAFDIWQRGTSFTIAGYTADRFYGGGSQSLPSFAQGASSPPSGFSKYMKFGRQNGSANTGTVNFAQALESVNSIPLQGQAVTLSFYAKAGANFSASGGNITVWGFSGTGTDQAASSAGSWTGNTYWLNTAQAITSSWVRYSFTGTVSASATQVGIQIYFTPVGTAGADDNIYITGVQLEIGSTATPFESRSIGQELALCQRYYYRIQVDGTASYFGTGWIDSATTAVGMTTFPVTMRTKPNALEQSGTSSHYSVRQTGGSPACTSVPSLESADAWRASTTFIVAAGLNATGQGCILRANNASAYLGWSAEL